MKNDDIYLVHNKESNIIHIKERDKLDPGDKVLRRLDLFPANMNDLVPLNVLMDNDDFYYEVYTDSEDNKDEYKIRLVGDVLLSERYKRQAEAIYKEIRKKEIINDSKINK